MWRRLWFGVIVTVPLAALGTVATTAPVGAARPLNAVPGATAALGTPADNPFCRGLGTRHWGSPGAENFCGHAARRGQPTRLSPAQAARAPAGAGLAALLNVDAATPAEDVAQSGVRGYGQSEVSVAAAGRYVVEEWNDSTGAYARCRSPMYKEEFAGFGFSANGGKSFTDMGGLPNGRCRDDRYLGDPSVAAYRVNGSTYFYFSSLYDPYKPPPEAGYLSYVALDACKVAGNGSRARLACGQPVIEARSSGCQTLRLGGGRKVRFCGFLDKDYVAIDPARGRLYMTYTEFPIGVSGSTIGLAACDLGNARGGPGPIGGTPAAPVCKNGSGLGPRRQYLTVAARDPQGCQVEGAYPAVDPATGTVYVGYEYNIQTDLTSPCNAKPTTDVLARVPLRCLPLAKASPCRGPTARTAVSVTSMFNLKVPGDSMAPNDFPRLAVSDPAGTVSMTWNDARLHLLGDILLKSFRLPSLRPVQHKPVVLDQPESGGLHMYPAIRAATRAGLLDVTWYSRPLPNTAVTNVDAVLGVSPVTPIPPKSNIRITTTGSNWRDVSSVQVINFGDYTDNNLNVTASWPYVGITLYIAWTDGSLGVPQPFQAHMPAG